MASAKLLTVNLNAEYDQGLGDVASGGVGFECDGRKANKPRTLVLSPSGKSGSVSDGRLS